MFKIIEKPWHREEHFKNYMDNVRCTYSMTVQIDITKLINSLKVKKMKLYPAQIYMLAVTVNRFPEFRMGLSESGEPGYWDTAHPSYTILNPVTKNFSNIWTAFDKIFIEFHENYKKDVARHKESKELAPQKDMPQNLFNISSLPWIDFTSFNLNIYNEGNYLLPIFTIGKNTKQNDKIMMPLALQLHHSACDGYHAGQFIESIRETALNCDQWI